MKVTLPHALGDSIPEPQVGEEICVRIDGTVETNEDGQMVLNVTDVSVENYSEEDAEDDGEEEEEPSDKDRHAIVIGIVKKKDEGY